jgi:predicted acylesterase/phospholipase RssA
MGRDGEKLMTQPPGRMQGVVLSSGGADGAYGVGVLKALLTGRSPVTGYAPLDAGIFVGSSIGALNAALLMTRLEDGPQAAASYLERVWLEVLADTRWTCGNGAYRFRLNPLPLVDPVCLASDPARTLANFTSDGLFLAQDFLQRAVDFAASTEPLAQRGARLLNFGSFVSVEPLSRLIENNVSFEKIRRSPTAFRALATDWTKGGLDEFSNDDMTDEMGPRIIKASAALPGFFPPVDVGGDIYVDAGVLGYTRLAPAIDAGADTLHVIYLDPDVNNIPVAALQSTLDTLYRMFVIQWADNVDTSIDAVEKVNKQIALLEWVLREEGASSPVVSLLQELLPPGRLRIGPDGRMSGLRPIAIHRYHPRDDYAGALGFLDLGRRRVEGLIARGFDDAVTHDCADSHCVLPQPAGFSSAVSAV